MFWIYFMIYIVGYVAAYVSFKKTQDDWTVGDRVMGLILSLFSWIAFLSAWLTYVVQNLDFKSKARW